MKLTQAQAYADRFALKAGILTPIRVVWNGTIDYDGKPCKVQRRATAHAHAHKGDQHYGTICIKRGTPDRAGRELMRHEVAHFMPGRDTHGVTFERNLAELGNAAAKRRVRNADIRSGRQRCPGHNWTTMGAPLEERASTRGLVRLYRAYCVICGKQTPKSLA